MKFEWVRVAEFTRASNLPNGILIDTDGPTVFVPDLRIRSDGEIVHEPPVYGCDCGCMEPDL